MKIYNIPGVYTDYDDTFVRTTNKRRFLMSIKRLIMDEDGRVLKVNSDGTITIKNGEPKMEYFGNSTSIKPEPNSIPIGATFLEIDTKEVFVNDGVQWVVF
jgi:hypothetical protein